MRCNRITAAVVVGVSIVFAGEVHAETMVCTYEPPLLIKGASNTWKETYITSGSTGIREHKSNYLDFSEPLKCKLDPDYPTCWSVSQVLGKDVHTMYRMTGDNMLIKAWYEPLLDEGNVEIEGPYTCTIN